MAIAILFFRCAQTPGRENLKLTEGFQKGRNASIAMLDEKLLAESRPDFVWAVPGRQPSSHDVAEKNVPHKEAGNQ